MVLVIHSDSEHEYPPFFAAPLRPHYDRKTIARLRIEARGGPREREREKEM
jgi:hypothetical protein